MNPIAQIFRFAILIVLALAGFAMAVVFLISTAIALGVLYIVAKVRGKPFAPAAFWAARRQNTRWQFNRGRWTPPQSSPPASHDDTPNPGPRRAFSRPADTQVIDVEARDIR